MTLYCQVFYELVDHFSVSLLFTVITGTVEKNDTWLELNLNESFIIEYIVTQSQDLVSGYFSSHSGSTMT